MCSVWVCGVCARGWSERLIGSSYIIIIYFALLVVVVGWKLMWQRGAFTRSLVRYAANLGLNTSPRPY